FRTGIDDFAHELVSENVAGFHCGNEAIVQMQVRPADGGRSDLHNCVPGIQNLRIGYLLDLYVFLAHPTQRFHFALLSFALTLSCRQSALGIRGSARDRSLAESRPLNAHCPALSGSLALVGLLPEEQFHNLGFGFTWSVALAADGRDLSRFHQHLEMAQVLAHLLFRRLADEHGRPGMQQAGMHFVTQRKRDLSSAIETDFPKFNPAAKFIITVAGRDGAPAQRPVRNVFGDFAGPLQSSRSGMWTLPARAAIAELRD